MRMQATLWLLALWLLPLAVTETQRNFVIDWEHDQFLKDGQPFRFIAGSFHYFRAHPATWQKSLRTMRAAGLNAVTTYVEWSLHNPRDGVYTWEGIADLEKFIKYAIVEDLLVILRPGPYICAERDMGGFPYWLLHKYPGIQMRTMDVNYIDEVRIWYAVLFARISPYLYGNGGPIIMVQVENEYGSYFACDHQYKQWLRDNTHSHVKDNAVLFTNDGPNANMLKCGHIDGVLTTLDFGSGQPVSYIWASLRKVQAKGPLVNMEYYPGWLTHWSEDMQRIDTPPVKETFIEMLKSNASVNFYMFYGGTNFGFTAGANDGGPGQFQPDLTSYDYDAPMDEAGDPTPKYYALRDIIMQYLPQREVPVPPSTPKKRYGLLQLTYCCSLLAEETRRTFGRGVYKSKKPLTFEALNQYSGLVLYETLLPSSKRRDPSELRAPGLRDRGYVYVDDEYVGTISRETPIYTLQIGANAGQRLQIFVENQGRINYNKMNDFKGLVEDVTFDRTTLENWNMTKFPFENYSDIERLIKLERGHTKTWHSQHKHTLRQSKKSSINLESGPAIFYGMLEINAEENIGDTYIDMTGWGKGIVFVNSENLGRYWPLVGPQITLYVPAPVLKVGLNQIVVVEYQSIPADLGVLFADTPKLDGQRK